MNQGRFNQLLTRGGVTLQLLGLAIDVWAHGRDPGLAAREGVLTLGNPGHALFALGLALVLAGMLLDWTMPQLGQRRQWRWMAPLIVLFAVGSFVFAYRSGGLTAQHDAGPNHADKVAGQPDHGHSDIVLAGGSADLEESRHTHSPEVPISYDQLQRLLQELDRARRATEKYRDVNVALAAGYIQVTQDLPAIAAHFINPRLSLQDFDPARPQILLYTKQSGEWQLVGVSYTSTGLLTGDGPTEQPPEGFSGPLDVWHYHENLCFVAGPRVFVAGRDDCLNQGGLHVARTPWMLHVWLWDDAPEGIFAHANSNLKGSPN